MIYLAFTDELQPASAAVSGKVIWDRNYHNFITDIKTAHNVKSTELARYSNWGDKLTSWVQEITMRIMDAIKQFVRFARYFFHYYYRFSTTMILMSNYYIWKHGFDIVKGVAQGMLA
jgi:hypothetical protein